VILPGTNQTSSFICAGMEGAIATHYTVDHGLGAVQKRQAKEIKKPIKEEYNYIFNYYKNEPSKIALLGDRVVKRAVKKLNKAGIIKTVARLKPLATLKGPKSKIV